MLFTERPITVDQIRAFCEKFNEGYRIEYKSNLDGSVRDKIPKILSSFANSNGGVLVVGVKTISGAPIPPFEGFQDSSHEEYPLTLENICLQNIYPPILPRTTVIQSDIAENVFLVVEVEESAQAPHAIENSKLVYVRTGNASNPYDLAEVGVILDLVKRRTEPSELAARLTERARNRFARHIQQKRESQGHPGYEPRPILQISVGPRFPSRQLCQQEDLLGHARGSGRHLYWRGFPFPDLNARAHTQHESAIILDPARVDSIFEATVWGMLYYGARIGEKDQDQPNATPFVPLDAFLGFVLLFVVHASRTLDALGYAGLADIVLTLKPILGVPWMGEEHWIPTAIGESVFDTELSFPISTDSELLRTHPGKVASEIYAVTLHSVDCSRLVSSSDAINGLVHRGCVFNDWNPTKLGS